MPRRYPEPEAPPPLTSAEFAARFQAGARTLWTLAAGVLGDPAEAEDVLQEAYVAAAAKRDQFRADTNFLAWVGRFVRHLALNERRKRGRRRTRSADPETLDLRELAGRSGRASPLACASRAPIDERGALHVDQAEFDDELLAGLEELGETPRSCLLLRVLLELSYAETARVPRAGGVALPLQLRESTVTGTS
jgi:RNA polymerase sigma-70 factor (ECF subfamily)